MTGPTGPAPTSDASRDEVGKHGILRAVLEPRGGRTIVADQFWRVPLQVMPPSYQDDDGQAFLYLLNPTGGLVQGDRLEIDVMLRPRAQLLLTTQSATKAYRVDRDAVRETQRFVVEENALLEYLPDQTIPYAGARLRRSTHIHAHETATVIAGEILSAGRVARGEVFEFDLLQTEISVDTGGTLRLLDRLTLEPRLASPEDLGLWEGRHQYGALYAVAPGADQRLGDRVAAYLDHHAAVRGGVSMPDSGVLVARMLAATMWELKEAWDAVWDLLRRHLVGKPARALRKL